MVTARVGFLQLASFTNYFIFLCSLSFVPVSTQDDKIRCSIPSVELFQDTVLTCHFPEDLSVTKKDFTVYHYVEQGNPESILDCWWVRGSQECYSKPGFTYDKRVNQTLNLTVDRVVDGHVGRYSCQIAGYGYNFLEPCEFLLKLDANNRCNISKGNNDSQITLTCFFNEDIKKTQKNLTVYMHKEQEKQNVIDCWWENGNQKCREEKDYIYLYDEKVSTYFNMAIPTATNEKTLTYSCWHGGSHGGEVKTCSFVIDGNGTEPERKKSLNTLALGLSLGILVLTVTTIAGIVLFVRKRRSNKASSSTKEEESLMVSKKIQPDKVTEEFQAFLLDKVNDMYLEILNKYYFVPPVYFNKTQYSQKSVADQVVDITDPPNLKDRAMQHVIHCLRHMAEQYQEQMFVLTQFSYDDYLSCPSPEYTGHRLPVPGGVKGGTRDQDIGCFDVLIIHRHHGVVVGVVKALSDKEDGSEDGERKTDEQLISEMSEGLRQLQRAERMIRHLMSDKSSIPVVRMSLMVPNITKSTLTRVFEGTNKGKDDKTMKTTIELCLCADDLSNPSRPWDIASGVMSSFREWWHRLMSSAVHGPSMSDEVYRDMIARFCGPATVAILRINESNVYQLPKTLNEAVMLTGDLFERLTLSPDVRNLLEEPRVCLTGPPGTGKSKTLAVVGKKWISEGHTVHLINTCPEVSDAITQLHKLLVHNSTGHSPDIPAMSVKHMFCDIKNSKSRETTIKRLISEEKEKTFFALIDEPDADKNKMECLKGFLQNLHIIFPNLHLWLAICDSNMLPLGWKGKPLNIPFSCPSSVIREAWKERREELYLTTSNLLPTDGLPVKNIYHRDRGHTDKEPRDCQACGQEIVRFLAQDLRVANQEHLASHQTTSTQSTCLQWKDILFFFERDVTEATRIIKILKMSGIQVIVMNSKNKENVLKDDRNIALAVNPGLVWGRKRKVVVYVEGAADRSTSSAKWKKRFNITRCTSQLVLVHMS